MTNPPLPSATRRVKLHFDKDGSPAYESVTSPECFKQNALAVLPPRDTIPVVFVPGIMGSNLKLKKDGKKSWNPPNTTGESIKALVGGIKLRPSERQVIFDPENTVVSYDGPCAVPDSVYWLSTEEARLRGWGSLHAASYLGVLQHLEVSLNDQYTRPGRPREEGNYLLDEIGLLQYLGGGAMSERAREEHDYAALAQKAVQGWGETPEAFQPEEIVRLDDYYYPVWAYGYNWLRCNSEAAEGLIKFIDEKVLPRYEGNYFRHQGKVILVTHSMGGLVARRAAQLAPDKILGVVQGVCPLAGAPVVYRRFRAGTEYSRFNVGEWGFAKVIGDDAAAVTPELACSPGALELAPSQFYPKGWLQFRQKSSPSGDGTEIASLPKEDPYEEIYKKTTDECWWGMLDPDLIDPAGLIKERDADPLQISEKAIDKAKSFHATVGHYVHPNTYGFYGNDDKKHRAFGHVVWQTSHAETLPADLLERKDLGRTHKGKSWVSSGEDARIPAAPVVRGDIVPGPYEGTITFKVLNVKDQAGDGTVPEDSAKFLKALNPKMALAISGYDHQAAYGDTYVYYAAIYGIARIVQAAALPVPDLCR
ncbi:MAG: alpha/beta hydrolase [Azoarcus sp.]|jgi:pimeloyl-ACP methyl ester carboxylesterase|nr:alpha/beta hydrolase [Azoarcus sp.]